MPVVVATALLMKLSFPSPSFLPFSDSASSVQRAFRLGGAHGGELALGYGEADVYRRDLGDGDQRASPARASRARGSRARGSCARGAALAVPPPACTIVARIDQDFPGQPGGGRVDVGVAEIELGGFDVGLIEFDRGFILLDYIGLVFPLLRRDRIFLLQCLISVKIGLGLGDQRLIVRELRLSLVERRLIRAGIDEKQRIALLHDLSLGEEGLHDLAADPGLHVDGLDRLNRAERLDDDGDVLADDRGHVDRNGRGGRPRGYRDAGRPAPDGAHRGDGGDRDNGQG